MIKICFPRYRERTISSVNRLLNIFRNQDLYNFVENEIKSLWDEFSREKSLVFFEFVKVFFRVHPIEALLILKEKIEVEDSVIIEANNIDTEKGKNNQSVTNEIIEILSGYANMEDLPTALDLFFQYYLKRPDLYMQFYNAINLYFGIQKDSNAFGYITQITFLEKLKEYSADWKEETVVILFFEVAQKFLNLSFHLTEGGRKGTFIMYTIPLSISEGVEKYRKIIWRYISELNKNDRYKYCIRKVLNSYGGHIEDISISVVQLDLVHIKSIVEEAFPPAELRNCILAEKLVKKITHINICGESLFPEYFKGECFRAYLLLKGPDYNGKIESQELQKLKQQEIEQYISNCDLIMFKWLIDICCVINDLDSHMIWRIGGGLKIAFAALFNKRDFYVDAMRYYIQKDTPNNLHPNSLVKALFMLLTDSEVYDLINSYEYNQKNAWLYAYYHELPQELITEKHLLDLYDFLSDPSDGTITSSSYRDVDFLEKYCVICNEAYINGCKIILEKKQYSPFIVGLYFDLMFNDMHNDPQSVIQKFNYNMKLLEEIYIVMLTNNPYLDYNGRFLAEIYLSFSSILDKYIDYLISKSIVMLSDHSERIQCFFKLANFKDIYDKIFEHLIRGCQFPTMSVPFLESILLQDQDNQYLLQEQDEWIQQCIQLYAKDTIKMYCIFSLCSKLIVERKRGYLELFLEYNQSFEDFKKIPLVPTSCSWSGSAVPIYSARIDFFESLLPLFIGLKWIEHKNHIVKEINDLKKRIEAEQIEEILRG